MNPEADSIEPMPWMQMSPRPASGPIYREVRKTDQANKDELQLQLAAAEAKAEVRVREAREAGLDDESIESLLRVTLQAAPEEEIA